MKLELSLRHLLLSRLQRRRLEALQKGNETLVQELMRISVDLRVTREPGRDAYIVRLGNASTYWTLPVSDFVFYPAADRLNEIHFPTGEDPVYESNQRHADAWLDTILNVHG